MAVCNLKFSDCYSCVSSGKELVQLQNKLSYCCVPDAAAFLRPIEKTYKKLSKCAVEGVAEWIVLSSVGAACIVALAVLVAVLCIWFCKKTARRQPDEETGLLRTGQVDYGFNFSTAELVNETFQAAHQSFEMVHLDEVVVEGARSQRDNQKPTSSSFHASSFKSIV